jgi:quercetin dioxygenase-like cupin family protein
MAVRLARQDARGGTGVEERLRGQGLEGRSWANGPGDRYGWHAHPYDKVLFCVHGSVVFHTRHGDYALAAGDRLDIDAGVEHAATVGPDGVRCVEASVSPDSPS